MHNHRCKVSTIETFDIIDKRGWPDGTWMSEPDKIQWMDEDTNLPCLIVRNAFGALCGYVGVNKKHPYYGVSHHAIEGISVYRGLSYSSKCDDRNICHKVEEGDDDDIWWIGFGPPNHSNKYTSASVSKDCEGFLKAQILSSGITNHESGGYDSIELFKAETKNLAKQLASKMSK